MSIALKKQTTLPPGSFSDLLKQTPDLAGRQRFASIDILRGAIMLIMAIDHVRHFLHQPAMNDEPTNLATTTPILFFTRLITHFCAPGFLFLSGISAFISGQWKTKQELSFFLIKRGCWLLFVDMVIIGFSWRLDPLFHVLPLQVIWAIGWSMIILGILVRTSIQVIAVVGILLFAGHNITDYINLPQQGAAGTLMKLLLTTRFEILPISGTRVALAIYAILPWSAIMLLGYAMGYLFKNDFPAARRRKVFLLTGIGLVLLFIVLRLINQYGDPSPWTTQKNAVYTMLSFLNVTKYPVSLQYSCMTLGPLLIILAVTKGKQNAFTRFLCVFGKVPFFYYVLHFFLIHAITALLFFATGHSWAETNDPASLVFFRPVNFGVSLVVVYLIWLLVIAILYFPCRWFYRYKASHKKWWLSYI